MFVTRRSLLIVCSLAVTYKRIMPRQQIAHTVEPSREPNRANVSRKRKKPGAGTYRKETFHIYAHTHARARARTHTHTHVRTPPAHIRTGMHACSYSASIC